MIIKVQLIKNKRYFSSGKEIWYQSTDNDASSLLSEMKKPHYDFIRTDERFAAIEEKLASFAGKWE